MMDIELLIKYCARKASPSEALRVHDWKNESEINSNVYEHILSVWQPEYNYKK